MQAYTRARALGLMNARVCVRVCDTQHRFSLSAHMLTVSQCRARRVACRASDKEGDERSSTPPLDLTSNTTGSNSEGQQPTQSRSFSKEARPTTNGINLINTSLTFLVFRLVLIGQGPPVLALWNNVDAADLSPTDSFALLLASDLFQLAVVLGILLRLQRPKSLPQTSQAGDWPARVIGVGLAGGVGSFAALSALPSPEGAAQNTKEFVNLLQHLNGPLFLLSLLSLTVIGPLHEELFFRGYLLHGTKASLSSAPLAVGVSSILFAAVHFSPVDFVPLTSLGAVLAVVALVTNVWGAVLAHSVYNALVLYSAFHQ